jgi:hypothetical protein
MASSSRARLGRNDGLGSLAEDPHTFVVGW